MGQVVRVSLETLRIVGGLPEDFVAAKRPSYDDFGSILKRLRGGDALGQFGALHFRGDLG